jgi:cyclopropane fatty-acyl-phospholipid synthase-like methyltransferase
MSYFLHDYLKVFTPHAVPALVSPACMGRIEAAAKALDTVDGGGFECCLGEDGNHADFAVRLSQRDLAGLPELAALPPGQRGVWARVHALATAWSRTPNSAIAASATKLWLEYDIDDRDEAPAPSVFVGLGKAPERARACAAATLELLLDEGPAAAAKAWVARCFDALPSSARVAFVGVLLPRPGQLVNLNIIALPNEGIAPLLAALDWPGDREEVAALAHDLGAHCDRLALSLSFDPRAGAPVGRIGLECFVDRPVSLPVWARMLDHFVELGLCTPRKRDATLAWAGVSPVDPSRPDDSNLAKVAALLGDQVMAAFTRRLNHLKLSHTPGRAPNLKAYFDFGHVIARRDAAAGAGAKRDYVEAVRDYYDRFAASIVDTVGTTYQAGMVTAPAESSAPNYAGSNLYLARQAGLAPGMAVLDAGCGTCGPSIDIAAAIPELSIDALTISREQAKIGREQVRARGLERCIRVHVGDYHDLPFHDRSFDRVLFFETLGYAYELPRLCTQVHRVLRRGGCVYVKDTFVREGPLSPAEQRELEAHDRRYVYRTPRMSTIIEALIATGLEIELVGPLANISTRAYDEAVARHGSGEEATDFGRHHHHQGSGPLPIYFGELRARKVD